MINSQRQQSVKNSEFPSDKAYSSNPASQFQSHFSNYVYQYPIEKKQEINETINSENSLPSIDQDLQQQPVQPRQVTSLKQSVGQRSSKGSQVVNQFEVAEQQRLESQNQSMQIPLTHNHLQLDVPQVSNEPFSDEQQQIPRDFQLFQPKPAANQQQRPLEASFDGISQMTGVSSRKFGSKLQKNQFYYDRIGNQTSEVLPPGLESQFKFVVMETIAPLCIAMIVYVVNYVIQREIKAFCYIDVCECSSFDAQLWTWIRQLIMYKLGLIVYRKLIVCRLAMGSNNLKHKEPIMEYFLLYFVTISLDFILIVFVEINSELVFIVLIYIVGIAVLLNAFRIRDWSTAFFKGVGILYYDVCMLGLVFYIFYALPNILESLQVRQGRQSGLQSFYYLYPILDLVMEIWIDWIITQSQYAELYIYQVQLMIIGVRVGILNLVDMTTFEFWYLVLVLGLMRANNSSMFLTVFLRRWLYYLLPQRVQFFTKMSETRKSLKGKHGAYLEHQLWIFFFYFFYLTKTNVPFVAKRLVFISNCSFDNEHWNNVKQPYQPLIIWLLLMSGTLLGFALNKKSQYDNIKLFGGTNFNLAENALIRLAGYYLFQLGVAVPLIIKQLNDMERMNSHSLTSTTTQA